MKSTFLKAVKIVALSLALSLGASGIIFANGAGATPTKTVAFNGAGSSTTSAKRKAKRRVARRPVRRARVKTASHSTH